MKRSLSSAVRGRILETLHRVGATPFMGAMPSLRRDGRIPQA